MRTVVSLSLLLSLAAALPARAADGPLRRFAVVAGASMGGPERVPLRYATSDARAFSRVLRRLGGVALPDLVLLEEPDADRLRSVLATISAEASRVRSAGRRAELFVYYSGHSDGEGLLLGSSRLPYAELRRMLGEIPADVRVAILDSCASGAFTRAKGGVHQPPFLLDESSRVSGHAFLTSSAADEAAQESDRLKASFFTHALVTGLRGAADASGDGVVTLNEAYQFAFRETLAGTEATQSGPQHATYDIGLVGSGDVVMTDLRRADALLVLPDGLDGRVFVRNAAGQLVAELRKVRGTRIELALEEGRYDVRIAREPRVLAAVISLPANARTVLDESRLWEVPIEPTAARGDLAAQASAPTDVPIAAPPLAGRRTAYAVHVRGGPELSMRPGSPRGFQAEVAAEAWAWGIVGLELGAGYGRVSGTTEGRLPAGWGADNAADVVDDVTTVPGLLTLKLGVPTAPFHPYLLGGAGVYFMRIDRRSARETPWQGEGRLEDDTVFLGFHVGAGATIRLSPRLLAVLEARYAFQDPQVLQEHIPMDSLRVSAGVGYSF